MSSSSVDGVDKASLRDDSYSFYSDGISAVWRARLFLFIGFAFMAGGLAGSVVRKNSGCFTLVRGVFCKLFATKLMN